MLKRDYSKQDFIKFWGNEGYLETWDGDGFNWSEQIQKIIMAQIGNIKDKVVVEIGCGAGYWTKFLCENSSFVNAVDVIPKLNLPYQNYCYYENEDRQFCCPYLQDESVDFVFSFGVFCHFSQFACEEYLKDIKRILRKDGTAILMYADKKGLRKFHANESISVASIFGDAIDYDNPDVFVKKHFDNAERILDFRHALFLVKKT
jgi:SAM-dependent methyltransferase